jgi:aspartate carbamoyltransferase catalytic subunit
LRIQKERQEGSYFPGNYEYARFYGLQQHHLHSLDKPPLVLHPGPMNRGVEISSEVADRPDSLILDQVENGVAVRMAVLFLLASRP